jgi:histidinol-phosphate aminotransferase
MGISTKYDPGMDIDEEGWLRLHRNENLFADSAFLSELTLEALGGIHINLYPDAHHEKLRDALARFYDVAPDNIYVGNGADGVLADLLSLLRERYDDLYVLDACFRVYYLLAARYAYHLKVIPGDTFLTGRVVSDGVGRSIALIDSPNAITSASLQRQDLLELRTHSGAFCIWDNVYGEFARDELDDALLDNVAIVRSFSKFYGLAALRVGYCIAHPDIVRSLLIRKDAFNVSAIAQQVARAALLHHGRFQRHVDEVIDARRALIRELSARDFRTHGATANFVLTTHPKCSGEELQRQLLAWRVGVRRFGELALAANHIRITVPPSALLPRLMQAIDAVLCATGTKSGINSPRMRSSV